jgi:hypothetical protein
MQAIFDAGVEAGSAKPKRNDATQTIFVTLATLSIGTTSRAAVPIQRERGFLEDMIEQPPIATCPPRRSKSGF